MAGALRIAINAQLVRRVGAGGTESVLRGLVSALGQLQDGDEEYVLLVSPLDTDWLDDVLGPKQRVAVVPSHEPPPRTRLHPLRLGQRAWQRSRDLFGMNTPTGAPELPISDGFIESLGCQLIHFPTQSNTLCALPTVYNPHDLQHRHYPQFFDPNEIAWREVTYRGGCDLARRIVVASEWVKQDLVREFGVQPGKIQVIPWAPPTQAARRPDDAARAVVQQKYRLEAPFVLYPAMVWEHKNHLRLLDAIALLRDQFGLALRLVCTGKPHDRFWPRVAERLRERQLEAQVSFLGLVTTDELRAIYSLAQFVVVPTLFEAASAPLFEAWEEGVAVTCSNVTSLPEQAGDSALIFDPLSVDAIAAAMRRLATEPELRADLVRRGAVRLAQFDWKRTATAYRAVYRSVAGVQLTDQEQALLRWDWMQNSKGLGS